MKKPISEASRAELKAFADLNNIEIPNPCNDVRLASLIRSAFPGITEIDVEGDGGSDAAEVEVTNFETGQLSTHYKDDPKVTVLIAKDELSKLNPPLPICVGSDHIVVRRAEPVTMPWRFFEALMNTVETDRYQGPLDPVTMRYETIEVQKPAINFSVLKSPPQAEIDAWFERTKDIGRGDDAIIEHRKLSAIGKLLTEAA